MSDDIVRAYDETPYVSRLQPQSHPRRLATLAWLHGIETASPLQCRVLELGCADGGNLLPMAADLPDSTFLGVDLVPSQIERGVANARDLELTNVELRAASIAEPGELGTYDFIICHGVLSWVARDVQESIFSIVREHLAPNGIAFISYNALPGWHFRNVVRDLARFHGGDLQQSIDLVRFIGEGAGESDHWYAKYLQTARKTLEECASPSYFAHEYLAETNEPLYFRDFMARAAQHELQYVQEADVDTTGFLAERYREYTNDRIEREQYADFAIARSFRRTLLAHAGAEVSAAIDPERIRSLFIASSRVDPINRVWPESISFDQLGFNAPDQLASLFLKGVIELDRVKPNLTRRISDRPRASKLARWEASRGETVTNQRQHVVKLDPQAREALVMLDGKHDRMHVPHGSKHLPLFAKLALLVG